MTQFAESSARQWLVAYDIRSHRARRRVAALLAGHGLRVQRSVFMVESTQHAIVALLKRAEALVAVDDRLQAWPVTRHAGLPTPWQRRQQQSGLPDYWLA